MSARNRTTSVAVDVAYELPATLRSIQDGWISTSQTAATVSALIAAGDSQLLAFMKGIDTSDPTEPFSSHAKAFNVMLGFLYTGLFLSTSATITPLIITDIFGEWPLDAARNSGDPEKRIQMYEKGAIAESLPSLLGRYGVRPTFRFITWHWLFSFIFGIMLSLSSVLVYILIEESRTTKILLCFVFAFSVFPCFYYYLGLDSLSSGTRGNISYQYQDNSKNPMVDVSKINFPTSSCHCNRLSSVSQNSPISGPSRTNV